MNETIENVCGCNPCAGSSCTCGCQDAVTRETLETRATCACGPQCACGDACRAVSA